MQSNKIAICELSRLFATATGCCGNNPKFNCDNCTNEWGCLMMEIARQVQAMGYVKTKTHVSSTQAAIESAAKEIARTRGYGCDEQASCSKCTCASMLDCTPLRLANCMVEAGYE